MQTACALSPPDKAELGIVFWGQVPPSEKYLIYSDIVKFPFAFTIPFAGMHLHTREYFCDYFAFSAAFLNSLKHSPQWRALFIGVFHTNLYTVTHKLIVSGPFGRFAQESCPSAAFIYGLPKYGLYYNAEVLWAVQMFGGDAYNNGLFTVKDSLVGILTQHMSYSA
jgi:hypothetical protein